MARRSNLPGADELFRATRPAFDAKPPGAGGADRDGADQRTSPFDDAPGRRRPQRAASRSDVPVGIDSLDRGSRTVSRGGGRRGAERDAAVDGRFNDRFDDRNVVDDVDDDFSTAREADPRDRTAESSATSRITAAARSRAAGVRRVSRARQQPGDGYLPSGRERHDEKITVYVSPQELLDLERARWVLRAEHGLASDRGRIVREAVAVVLADFAAKGADSILVTRLQDD